MSRHILAPTIIAFALLFPNTQALSQPLSQRAAIDPLDAVAIPDIRDAAGDASAFEWVRVRFGVTAAERDDWETLVRSARAVARRRFDAAAREVRTSGLHLRQPAGDGCWGHERCEWVLRTSSVMEGMANLSEFAAAWDEARPQVAALFAALSQDPRLIMSAESDFEQVLLKRLARDQFLRAALAERNRALSLSGRKVFQLFVGLMTSRVDRENAEWLQARIASSGWPRLPQVSGRAEEAAWFLVIHARHDPSFRLAALNALRRAWHRDGGSGARYASRADHILYELTGFQRYGTKGECRDGRFMIVPVADQSHLPTLRHALGLPTIAEQNRIMARACSLPSSRTSPDAGSGRQNRA